MVRPPISHDRGWTKGPWTPDEDITLVSYINQHGPNNWSQVSTNSGLLRYSKSCRMRWINYLRPGIKRGNSSEEEERMIINLHALLGNTYNVFVYLWSAIATYLPQRTDNDIKNYWNTHLKKKMNTNGSTSNQGNVKGSGDGFDNNPIGNWESITRANLPAKSLWARRLQTDIHIPPPTTTSLSNVSLTNNEGLMVQDSVTQTYVNYQQQNWMCPFNCREKWLPHDCMEDIN